MMFGAPKCELIVCEGPVKDLKIWATYLIACPGAMLTVVELNILEICDCNFVFWFAFVYYGLLMPSFVLSSRVFPKVINDKL